MSDHANYAQVMNFKCPNEKRHPRAIVRPVFSYSGPVANVSYYKNEINRGKQEGKKERITVEGTGRASATKEPLSVVKTVCVHANLYLVFRLI